MKKVLLLALFAVVAIAVSAQVRTTKLDFSIPPDGGYVEYTGVAGDTAVIGTNSSIDFGSGNIIGLKLYRVEAELDEISGSANCIAILQGSLNGVDFTEIDTLAGSTGAEAQSDDATVFIEDKSTGTLYRYFRIVQAVSTTGKWGMNYLRVYMVGKND